MAKYLFQIKILFQIRRTIRPVSLPQPLPQTEVVPLVVPVEVVVLLCCCCVVVLPDVGWLFNALCNALAPALVLLALDDDVAVLDVSLV